MRENEHFWLTEPLIEDPSFVARPMFGCQACYLHGLLVILFADGKQPWNGMLVATSHEHHAALVKQFPSLIPHPILGKWLYLSAESERTGQERFEHVARNIVALIARGSPLIGVAPKPRKRKRAAL